MSKKITPKDVATQFKWDLGDIAEFCADAFEEGNDHNMASALRAVNYGAYDIAIQYLELTRDQDVAGELTPELLERKGTLDKKLKDYLEEAP